MAANYLHQHQDFPELLQILERDNGILAGLVEKDYWIMHVLYGLQQQGFKFFLKGGTSLSKGYGIIDRFSEDIDILIEPPADTKVNGNPNNRKEKAVNSRKDYYDYLAKTIRIDGIVEVVRDHAFDDPDAYRSGGIRLLYNTATAKIAGVKEGILLEAGFDTVTPYNMRTISSWAYERAASMPGLQLLDNRAVDVACYHPGYTLVEKLQTIATKFRQEQHDGTPRVNLMRQYYDVYCLLGQQEVQDFIATEDYQTHKAKRFPKVDFEIPVKDNEAFLLRTPELRKVFADRYRATAALYYNGQPDFDALLTSIHEFAGSL